MSPFHRAPKRSSPSAEDLSSPHGADWPPSSLFVAEACSTEHSSECPCCLSSQSKRVHEPHSHALGRPATPLARWYRNRGNRELAPTMLADGKPPARDRTERLGTFDRDRAPFAGRCPCRGSSFPRERGETSRNDARDSRSHSPGGRIIERSLRSETRSRHVAKTTDTRLSLSGWSAPAETRATLQPKSWRPEPSRPNTDETATIARRNSTCVSPKTHRPSELERFLGHLRLDSPAKVGRFACGATPCGAAASCPECLPPSTEPVSSVAAACWRSHPCGACQAGT